MCDVLVMLSWLLGVYVMCNSCYHGYLVYMCDELVMLSWLLDVYVWCVSHVVMITWCICVSHVVMVTWCICVMCWSFCLSFYIFLTVLKMWYFFFLFCYKQKKTQKNRELDSLPRVWQIVGLIPCCNKPKTIKLVIWGFSAKHAVKTG